VLLVTGKGTNAKSPVTADFSSAFWTAPDTLKALKRSAEFEFVVRAGDLAGDTFFERHVVSFNTKLLTVACKPTKVGDTLKCRVTLPAKRLSALGLSSLSNAELRLSVSSQSTQPFEGAKHTTPSLALFTAAKGAASGSKSTATVIELSHPLTTRPADGKLLVSAVLTSADLVPIEGHVTISV